MRAGISMAQGATDQSIKDDRDFMLFEHIAARLAVVSWAFAVGNLEHHQRHGCDASDVRHGSRWHSRAFRRGVEPLGWQAVTPATRRHTPAITLTTNTVQTSSADYAVVDHAIRILRGLHILVDIASAAQVHLDGYISDDE